ncbi:MAG TPA: flagellar hook-basal body complex protein FliE [Fimbriimonadaceae bacterium]|nr:flagellar hook-basal body complex protein FliE [Fimbriimonadaceae bacterium]
MRIQAQPNLTQALNPAGPANAEPTEDFGQMLMDVLKDVNASQQESRSKQNAFMTNQSVDIDDLMISMERASVAMQLTMQVRNKALEAYQEIARMQV